MKYLLIPKSNYKSYFFNFDGVILPLKDYSIGFDYYYSVEEINELSKKLKVYVIINKFLHKIDIVNIKNIIEKIDNVEGYFIEDLGLTNIISKDKIIINQNHIINNYLAINYLNELGFKRCVVSNELTLEELKEIKNKTNSELYYFLINRNMLLYSKRKLVTNYFQNYGIQSDEKNLKIKEKVSNHELIIIEESSSTTIYDGKIFNAVDYKEDINYDFYIININNMSDEETEEIINNYKNNKLKINTENYFLLNEIGYKVKKDE